MPSCETIKAKLGIFDPRIQGLKTENLKINQVYEATSIKSKMWQFIK